ncbi:MAG: hypothetical protein HMLKMBBP_03985 [Planctomycetes bacterium]|nr:hypothetical protein [Planctomycetota bacterium]
MIQVNAICTVGSVAFPSRTSFEYISNFAPTMIVLAGLLLKAAVRRTTAWRGAELGVLAGCLGFLWLTAGYIW